MSTNRLPSNAHTDLLEGAVNAIFNRIQQEVQSNPSYELQDRDYLELHSVFGSVLARALEVLETSEIKQYISDFVEHNGIIEVVSSQDTTKSYKFYLGINYCPCPSFKFDVLQHRHQYTCKHNLAARLAITLNRIQVIKTSRLKFKGLWKELQDQGNENTV